MAENVEKVSSKTSSNIEPTQSLGNPNCPICHGIGFVYYNVPANDPNFGKSKLCTCAENHHLELQRNKLFNMSNLAAFQAKTFDNFNPDGRMGLHTDQSASLQYALNQSMLFAGNRRDWLLLMGDYGCGKTHLAAAIANDAVSNGIPTLFTTVPDLLDWLRFAYGQTSETFEDRFEHIRQIPLLVLDDLGTQNATEWAKEKLFQIINYRYTNRIPTVVTTNQQLAEMDGRIRSRLEDRDIVLQVRINAPDYRSPFTETSDTVQLSSLKFHANQTFDTFSLRETESLSAANKKNLKNVHSHCVKFAKNPEGWLVLFGTYGTGKTHLAAAIANECAQKGESPMFIMVPDLLDHLRATFNPASNISYDKLFDQIRTVPLLVLDDLGTQSATPWAREKLYQIFNYRYNAALPTIITTSQLLDDIDPRIYSRMLDSRICDIFEISAPPFRVLPTKPSPKRK